VNLTYRAVTLFSLRNNTRIANQIIILLEKSKYDVVWISYANISSGIVSKVSRNSRTIKIVSGTDSVWSEFLMRSIPYKPFAYKMSTYILGLIKKWQEKQLLRVSTVLTAVSEFDQNLYMKMSRKSCEVICAYNVIDSSSYSPRNARNRINQEPIVLLAGTFGSKFSPMDYGTSWFLREVWPLVRKSNPNALLHLVGKRSDLLWLDDSSIGLKVFGEFESIVPFMERSALSVVPLWFESGTRFKILEAGAMNLPVVTTTLGAEGLRIADCKDVYIADDPESFANSILDALQINYLGISENSLHKTVVKEYSEAVLVMQVDKIIAVVSADKNKDSSR
jgi:glycosyltransferase involved in cell wall biosynthesis